VPRGGVSSSRPNGARMPAAFGLECFPRILGYRHSYRLQRHPCGMPADVGWRWIGRAFGPAAPLRLDYLCVLAVASCYQRRPLRLPTILQWMLGGGVPNVVRRCGGCPEGRLVACRPRNCSRSWVEMSKNPRGTQPLYRHFRPLATVKYGNSAKYFPAAYCTHRAAFWHLPTIRLQQWLGLALGRLRGLGLLLGLALPLLVPLLMSHSFAPGGCGSCVVLLLLLLQGRGDATEPIRPPNGYGRGGRGDVMGLSTNRNKQERAPRSTPPGAFHIT